MENRQRQEKSSGNRYESCFRVAKSIDIIARNTYNRCVFWEICPVRKNISMSISVSRDELEMLKRAAKLFLLDLQ